RVRHQMLAVDPVFVERSRPRARLDELVPAGAVLHGEKIHAELQLDALRLRRPQAKAHAFRRELRAEGIQGFLLLRGHHRSRSSAAQSLPPMPKASASASTTPARTMR